MTRALRAAVLALLAVAPGVLAMIAAASGAGISQDSVSYIAAARSFAASRELLTFTGEPLTLFPPGLPVVLGVSESLGWSATSAAIALNVACGALLVLGTYVLGRMTLGGPWPALVAAAFVSLSSTTVHVLAMVWSEPLFSVLVLGTVIALVHAIRRGAMSMRILVLVAVLVSLATLVRYVGLVLIPVAGLGAWLAGRATAARARWRPVIVVTLASSVGLVVAAARNIALGSGALGERFPAARSLQGAIVDLVQQLGSYVAPPESTMLTTEAGVVVAGLLVVGAWLAVVRRNAPMALVAAFVAVYWGSMLWSQATTRLDTTTDRLAFPAFAPMVILAVYAVVAVAEAVIDQSARFCASSRTSWTRARGGALARTAVWTAVAVIGSGALALSLVHGVRFARAAGSDGLFLASGVSESSPLAQAARDLPDAPGVASNDPWLVYWVAGHGPVLPLPPDPAEWPAERVSSDLALLRARVEDGSVTHVASFAAGARTLPTPDLEAAGLVLTKVADYADGTLYRVAASG